MTTDRPQLTGLTPEELAAWLKDLGEPAFRARQVMDWLVKGRDFGEMRNLPVILRERLPSLAVAQPAAILERHPSRDDGTVKLLFSLQDGQCVEGVLMRYAHGVTLCLSTQVGCAMGCAFCASTLGGRVRNLTRGEMCGMAYLANRMLEPERLGNVVLMGSGEPLDNYEEVTGFLRLVSMQEGFNLGLRHISLSTCGLTGPMRRLADEGLPVTLSVSLHAPNDRIRTQIMPVARAFPMEDLLDACRYYIQQTGRRVVFEYALIHGVNALPAHARELASRVRGMQCHVNLIPLNDVPERDLRAAERDEVRRFREELERLNVSVTVRRQLGDDVAGACGQLRARRLKTPTAPGGEGGAG